MAKVGAIPRTGRRPSITGRFMVDTVRGVIRVRAWPKKYGHARSALQQKWIDWFTQANRLAKYADPKTQDWAREVTKGTGLYPRDVILKLMRGRLFWFIDQYGWKWYPMAALGDISETLDILAQTPGNILVRAVDRWRNATGYAVGRVLTAQAVGTPPIWAAPGGGVFQNEVPGSPLVLDGTKSQYDIDVSAYMSVQIISQTIALSASQGLYVRASVDGGVTFKAGATDYSHFWTDQATSGCGTTSVFMLSDQNAASLHQAVMQITGLQAPLANENCMTGNATGSARMRAGATLFTGPITHLRIQTSAGATFSSGTLRLFGIGAS